MNVRDVAGRSEFVSTGDRVSRQLKQSPGSRKAGLVLVSECLEWKAPGKFIAHDLEFYNRRQT